jgi:non-ribosomal peptide synthetase component F
MFDVQSFGSESSNELLEEYPVNLYDVAKFDISTFIDDSQECLKGSFNYAVSVYDAETIIEYIKTYTNILGQLSKLSGNYKNQEENKLYNIRYLDKEEREKIINEWNRTDKEYRSESTINELFEEQVAKSPDSIAVVYEDIRLTYSELNERANRLAHYLREKYEVKSDSLVGICLDRSEHILIGILAVLKAGGAYVPIDPSYPDDRIKYIIEDGGINK